MTVLAVLAAVAVLAVALVASALLTVGLAVVVVVLAVVGCRRDGHHPHHIRLDVVLGVVIGGLAAGLILMGGGLG